MLMRCLPARSLSGKVLKDEETLATYKLQAGHTVHMVKASPSDAPFG